MEYHDKYFTREEIIRKFQVFDGEKTLGEVDVRDVFHTQVPAKGIAGCVIEQSVLSMKQNSTQEADLSIPVSYTHLDVYKRQDSFST